MALGEDQVVVVGILRVVEVVAEVLAHQHGDEVGGRHGRGRMPRPGAGARADTIGPQLLRERAPLLGTRGPWLICCATTNLLGRIANSTDYTSPTLRWRFGNCPAAPGIDPTDGGLPALLESRGREEKDPDREFYASGSTG